MAEETRIWRIESQTDSLRELSRRRLCLEDRLENWLASDISLLAAGLIVIARQQPTAHGGYIDLLCMNLNGDLVLIELKRDKTPREVTAQALDYASWVTALGADEIQKIANDYLGAKGPLEDAFERQFRMPLPESLNDNHQILIVASEVDPHSERIIRYLSEQHGVNINAVTFAFYELDGVEYLSRNSLIEPSEVTLNETRRSQTKRPAPLSMAELTDIADSRGVGELFRETVEIVGQAFDTTNTTRTTVAFIGNMNGRRNTIFSLEPIDSNDANGIKFYLYRDRFLAYFDLQETAIDELRSLLQCTEDDKWYPGNTILRGWIQDSRALDSLRRLLNRK